MKPPLNPCVPSSVPSSSLCPSVRSSMRMDTLEVPRLPAAHHPSAECWVWHCRFLATKNGKEINQELHIVKDVGMRNEASSESVRLVILPLSIRPVVHADGHPGSSEVSGCTPSLCWVWRCSFLATKNGKEINQEWNNNNLRWWCCCRNVAS
jgi:hypothetical protein